MRASIVMLSIVTALSLSLSAAPHAVMKDGTIEIALPEEILKSKEMQTQLRSGLTTVLAATAEVGGGATGLLRTDIRYELWDEEYLVRTIDSRGTERRTTIKTADALLAWWKSLRLLVTPPAASRSARVRIEILPFSAEEELDVQRWLVRSIAGTSSGTAPNAASSHRGILSIVVGTGLRRDPIRTWTWSIPVTVE